MECYWAILSSGTGLLPYSYLYLTVFLLTIANTFNIVKITLIMRSTLVIITFCLAAIVACNNAEKNNNTASDTSMEAMDHHMAPAGEVSALPEVPAGAKVYFKNLKDGQTVTSPFKIEMGVSGMTVDSAGAVKPASGHHHLIIDDGDSLAAGTTVPKDSLHLHFGNAQTETTLTLPPGKHKLTLQFADGLHRSYGSQMAASVTVNVK
jgi:hypothetical protein